MGQPAYDAETLAAYFQPVAEALFDDPVVGPVLRGLAMSDPEILEAVADVDRSLIRESLARTPTERVRVACEMADMFARARVVGR